MNHWLVVHDLEAYGQNPRMLGFIAKYNLDGSVAVDKRGKPLPADVKLLDIKPGDLVVYYCRGDSVVKGIYEIVHFCYGKETKWPESPFQFEIIPIIELPEPYDFKPLVGSLELFKDLPDIRHWGLKLRGNYNSVKPLSIKDFNTIKQALEAALIDKGEEDNQTGIADYRKHLRIQHQIAEWGIKNGYRVYVAVNDKGKLKDNLPEILDEIPKFHHDDILDGAKRVDALFFHSNRNILTHAFEIEHTPVIYSGLLRLNDIAESYPTDKIQYIIVSDESNRVKFEKELLRPSFSLLRENNCRFVTYQEIEDEWKQLKNKRPPLF